MACGGAEEQPNEIEAGNLFANNRRDEAQKLLKTTVSHPRRFSNGIRANF
jgi:hypothetical protein